MHISKTLAVVFSVALAGLSVAPDASAQQAPAGASASTIEVTDAELDSFTEAYVTVQTIGQEHEAIVAGAATAEEAQALQQEAQVAMLAAVEESGIEPDRYTAIATALNDDEALRLRFFERLDAAAADQGR
ncbi:MAG: DUF4168 domain-containing protein [Gemmatimonadota bacterium]